MNALHLTLFVSAVLVAGWLASFFLSVKRRDHDHHARSALLPLQDDEHNPTVTPAANGVTR